ncbi:MAG: hypothetical protein ABIJ59_14235 [Pseudomonadota bacterium]
MVAFSKPVFINGGPEIIVRMGIQLAEDQFFSLKNLNLPMQILFFTIMALVFGYYGLMMLIKPIVELKSVSHEIIPQNIQGSVLGIVRQLEFELKQAQKQKHQACLESDGRLTQTKIIEYEYQQLLGISMPLILLLFCLM